MQCTWLNCSNTAVYTVMTGVQHDKAGNITNAGGKFLGHNCEHHVPKTSAKDYIIDVLPKES